MTIEQIHLMMACVSQETMRLEKQLQDVAELQTQLRDMLEVLRKEAK